jgi:hypothetical protein
MPRIVNTNFTRGVLSSDFLAFNNLQAYQDGLADASNFYIEISSFVPWGGGINSFIILFENIINGCNKLAELWL